MKEAIRQIIELKPDDNSGSTISNRYGYQKNWAMMKMLELERKGRDYMIVFDYHEDIMMCRVAQLEWLSTRFFVKNAK